MAGRKIKAVSYERYNGGARVKRAYGSSTVTRFYVFFEGDERDPSKWVKVEAYGATPGERKTYAIQRSGLLERREEPLVEEARKAGNRTSTRTR